MTQTLDRPRTVVVLRTFATRDEADQCLAEVAAYDADRYGYAVMSVTARRHLVTRTRVAADGHRFLTFEVGAPDDEPDRDETPADEWDADAYYGVDR